MKTVSDRDVKFLLKDVRATAPTLIYLVYRYDAGRFKCSTGQTVEPFQWDADRQRVHTSPKVIRIKRERETNETINAHLERYQSALLQVLNALRLARLPLDNDSIKLHLDTVLGRVKKEKPVADACQPATFLTYVDQFIKEAEDGKRLTINSRRYAPITIKGVGKFKRTLERYGRDMGQGINYADFTIEYYHAFKSWLTDRGLTLNYIGSLLKDFKLLLRQSHAEGLHQNTVFQHRDFKRLVEEVDNVYLSDDELNQLYALDLTKEPRLDRIRDLFLVGCYTGLRFSDFSQLRPENIKHKPEGQILTRNTKKTGKRVDVPLNPNVLAILAKYTGTPPRTITNQRMNIYLKELCQRARFTEQIALGRTKGGLRETRVMAKWELVTTHTARRSFATNAVLAGIDPISIMKITGHKSESMFMKYVKVDTEQNAVLLLKHPHFSGKPV